MVRAALVAFALFFGLATAAALAVQPAGTAAFAIWDRTVYDGPGTAYDELGSIAAESAIRVDRCNAHWCQFHAASISGWIERNSISFGLDAAPPFSGPRLDYPPGGADVCFYSGAGYTGSSFCVPPGHVVRDAKLYGKDNSFSSVMLSDGAKVKVCRDRDFRSWCVLVTDSRDLDGLLDNSVSSWRVF